MQFIYLQDISAFSLQGKSANIPAYQKTASKIWICWTTVASIRLLHRRRSAIGLFLLEVGNEAETGRSSAWL
jgi:hypothetical protein